MFFSFSPLSLSLPLPHPFHIENAKLNRKTNNVAGCNVFSVSRVDVRHSFINFENDNLLEDVRLFVHMLNYYSGDDRIMCIVSFDEQKKNLPPKKMKQK